MQSHPYYLDQEGKVVEYEDISSHIGIAIRYIDSNPQVKAEFEKSGIRFQTDFLVQEKGFIQVTDENGNGYYRNRIVFSASKMQPIQKRMVMQFIEDGYVPENVDAASKSVVKRYHEFLD